jgi:hypothetical protein
VSAVQWALQESVVARLRADAGVTALVGVRVYDGEAPEGASMPFLIVGEPTETPEDVLGRDGYMITLTFHAWSTHRGRKQVLEILEAMDAALTGAVLTLAGFLSARARREFRSVLVEDDGVRHGLARYRFITWKASA